MPELPEVETIVNNLRLGAAGAPALPGKVITGAQVLWQRTVAEPAAPVFEQQITGQAVRDIHRRGKYLVFELSHDVLLVHLRMSGDLLVGSGEHAVTAHTRLLLRFKNGLHLAFQDARKFGRVWLTCDPLSVLGRLGPEPFDEQLTAELFYTRLQGSRRQVKPLLLDQSFLAGLGNIYTDEALHLAKIHPQANAHSLELRQAERLLESIRSVLREGIRRQGASIDWVYRGGDFQNYFRVYRRSGSPCPACGTSVVRIVVSQRGTHICPLCQAVN